MFQYRRRPKQTTLEMEREGWVGSPVMRPLDMMDKNEREEGDNQEQAHRKHIMDPKLEPQMREQFIGKQM